MGSGLFCVAEGSTQIRPKNSFDVQVWEAVDVLAGDVLEIDVLVAECLVEVVESWQPNQPGDLQVEEEVAVAVGLGGEEVIADEEAAADVVVTLGAGAGVAMPLVIVVVSVVVISSLQPNQPGDKQVVVVMVSVVVAGTVVDSSKQPHHPGVLHVSVLVRVVDVAVDEELVVVSVPLLSKNFHS